MLRRLKQDVELKLPPKKELLVYAPMSAMQQEFYTSTVDKTILDKIKEKNVSEFSANNLFWRIDLHQNKDFVLDFMMFIPHKSL